MTKKSLLKSTVFAAAGLGLMAFASSASAAGVGACLITKTDTNPFFVKMKEGAT
ncbi:MAG: sugar ABC transporter substrate-binding protein, partial [Mesorhizobium sp.]